jgi:hypothetical protein
MFDENKSPHHSSVSMLNGRFIEITNDNVKLNSMLIEDVQKPQFFENTEKMETQEDIHELELKNKDKGKYILI